VSSSFREDIHSSARRKSIIIADNERILDGLNEKGLSVGSFYFPDFAQYPETTSENRSISTSSSDFAQWIVPQFAVVFAATAILEKNTRKGIQQGREEGAFSPSFRRKNMSPLKVS